MALVVVGIHHTSQSELFEIVEAGEPVGLFRRRRQRGQPQGRQEGDDRNDDQQFGKRKSGFLRILWRLSMHNNQRQVADATDGISLKLRRLRVNNNRPNNGSERERLTLVQFGCRTCALTLGGAYTSLVWPGTATG